MSAVLTKKKPTKVKVTNWEPLILKLRRLQRQRTIVMKSRNMQFNRLQAIVAGNECGFTNTLTPGERMAKFKEAADLIKAVGNGTGKCKDPGMESIIKLSMVGVNTLESAMDQYETEMKNWAAQLPVEEWIEEPEQRGFGVLFLAIIIGETGDLNNYANPAKLWRRMGCAPYESDGKVAMGSTWRYGKEGKLKAEQWEDFGYSPRRRSIAYIIGENFIKQNGKDSKETIAKKKLTNRKPRLVDGPYRKRYDETKAIYRVNHPDYSDLRCHRHGMLLATKLFLKNLWIEWQKRS